MNETIAARAAAWHRLVAEQAGAQAADSQFPGVDDATRETLLEFIDAEPGPDGSPVSRTDGTFNYIAAAVAEQTGVTGTDWLHRAFFRRLLEIWAGNPDFSGTLRTAARAGAYREAAAEFDRWLDGPRTGDPDRRPLLARQFDPADAITYDAWCDLLVGVPRLSHIPAAHVARDPGECGQPLERLTADDADHTTFSKTAEAWAAVAVHADPGLDLPVAARLDVARDLWQRRRFAKVRMLEFGWPDLMARVRTAGGPKWLRLLESAIGGTADGAELPEAWRALQADQRLVEFLRIRPFFSEIFDGVFAQASAAGGVPYSTPSPNVQPVPVAQWRPYNDVRMTFRTQSQSGPVDDPGSVWTGTVTVRAGSDEHSAEVGIPVGRLVRDASTLDRIYLYDLNAGRARPVMQPANAGRPAEATALELGQSLWDAVLQPDQEVRDAVLRHLAGDARLRLVIETDEPAVADLPWETLYLPSLRLMAGHTLKVSIVRKVVDSEPLFGRTLSAPIRILAVNSEVPQFGTLPAAQQEMQIMEQVFAEAVRQRTVLLQTVPSVTKDQLDRLIRQFRPHIFHFTGHSASNSPVGPGLAVLDDAGGDPILPAEELSISMQDAGVVLAVLNGCGTGTRPGDPGGEAVHSICQTLVRRGVPAVVATTRVVFDTPAMVFTRELYRWLVDGYPIEAAVSEARKTQRLKRWDWSAWALYANDSEYLDQIRLP